MRPSFGILFILPPIPLRYEAGWTPRVDLDAVEMRKTLHSRESKPGRPTHSPSLYQHPW
jgi:hypothetical protein